MAVSLHRRTARRFTILAYDEIWAELRRGGLKCCSLSKPLKVFILLNILGELLTLCPQLLARIVIKECSPHNSQLWGLINLFQLFVSDFPITQVNGNRNLKGQAQDNLKH